MKKVKFPVLIKNIKSFNLFMRFLESKGVKWRGGADPTSWPFSIPIPRFPVYVFIDIEKANDKKNNYYISYYMPSPDETLDIILRYLDETPIEIEFEGD